MYNGILPTLLILNTPLLPFDFLLFQSYVDFFASR